MSLNKDASGYHIVVFATERDYFTKIIQKTHIRSYCTGIGKEITSRSK